MEVQLLLRDRLSIFLSALLILTIAPIYFSSTSLPSASAATVAIKQTYAPADAGEFVIPSGVETLTVTAIGGGGGQNGLDCGAGCTTYNPSARGKVIVSYNVTS